MKPRFSNQQNHAMTRVELLVVVFVLVVLVAMLIPALNKAKHRGDHIDCINNVKQVSLAFRIWAYDRNGKFPMEVSVTNGGTMELAATGDVITTFQVMSNELLDPRILYCPQDTSHSIFPIAPGPLFISSMATNFSNDLKNHISYFIGLDARTNSPQALLAGDDNFEIGGVPVKPGLFEHPANSPVSWTSGRHTTYKRHFWNVATSFGNIGLADGSVRQTTISSRTNLVELSTGTITTSLTSVLQATGLAANRPRDSVIRVSSVPICG